MSVDSSSPAASRRASPWRFTIVGLLLLTVAVAVQMAAFEQGRGGQLAELPRSTLLGLSVLLVVGLLTEALDLAREARRDSALSPAAKTDYWFAAVWRVGISVVLLGYHAFEFVDSRRLAFAREAFGWWIDLVYCLALVIIVAASRRGAASPWWTTPFFLLLAWVFSVACFAVGLYEQLKAHAWKQVARGALRASAAAEAGAWLTLSWTALLPLAFGSLYFVARGSASRWRRRLYGSLFAVSLGATLVILLSHAGLGWAAILPYAQAEAREGNLFHFLRVAGPFLVMLGTTLAYFWCVRQKVLTPAHSTTATAPRVYLHENRLVFALLAISLVADIVVRHWEAAKDMVKYSDFNPFGGLLGFIFRFEPALPLLGLALILLYASWTRRRSDLEAGSSARELPFRRFLGVWTAVMVATFVGVCTMSLAGFCYWLTSASGR
jgi:Ca2+/H+ antiporter